MSQAYIQLMGAVLLNVSSYAIYKAIVGMAPRAWWPLFVTGLMLGAINTFLFTRAIKELPLSIAFPAFSGASFALITLVSVLAFGEHLRGINIAGMVLIVVGSVLVLQNG